MSSPVVTPNPATSVVDTQVVSPKDFAAKIKEKYPQYGSVPDGQLIQKVLQKYPQYGNQIQGYAQTRKDHQGALVMTGKEFEDLGLSKSAQPTRTDKVANFITRNDPTIGAMVGSVGGGVAGGLPGAVAGAAAGGAAGSALQQKVSRGTISPKETAKAGGEQAAWELGGGLVGKGIAKTATLLGVPEAVMKFALHTGEDLETGVNPSAALNKFKVRAALTKDLYEKTGTQIGSLSKVADNMLDSALPYAPTIRPSAVISRVIDKYDKQAAQTADPQIRAAMQDMLQNVQKEFGTATGGKTMTIKEANALKRTWGDSVDWSKAAPTDKMQAVFKAEMAARREIYGELNQSIADAMGPKEGKAWLAQNKDIQSLMEAKSAIRKSAEGLQSSGKNIFESLTDVARRPGVGSRVAQGADYGTRLAQTMGSNLPTVGRGALLATDAVLGNNNVPMTQK